MLTQFKYKGIKRYDEDAVNTCMRIIKKTKTTHTNLY